MTANLGLYKVNETELRKKVDDATKKRRKAFSARSRRNAFLELEWAVELCLRRNECSEEENLKFYDEAKRIMTEMERQQ